MAVLRSALVRALLPALLALPFGCGAYTVTPSVATLRAAGSGASTFFRLQNREAKPAAVEITIHEHRKDVEGNAIVGAPADDSFVVYPQQLVMVPGDEAAVQVRWIGDPALRMERAFSLVAREVAIPPAVAPAEVTSGVRVDITVLLNYEARLYVAPAGAAPRLVVEAVAELPPAAGDPRAVLQVTVANEGTAHQDLRELSLLVMPVDAADRPLRQQSLRIAARELPGTRPHLLAGGRRHLLLPRPGGFPPGRVHVELAR